MKDIKRLSPEQEQAKRKYEAVESLARKAGMDEIDLASLEFSLIPFFNLVVEECASQVECKHSAEAIRNYSKNIGNE